MVIALYLPVRRSDSDEFNKAGAELSSGMSQTTRGLYLKAGCQANMNHISKTTNK